MKHKGTLLRKWLMLLLMAAVAGQLAASQAAPPSRIASKSARPAKANSVQAGIPAANSTVTITPGAPFHGTAPAGTQSGAYVIGMMYNDTLVFSLTQSYPSVTITLTPQNASTADMTLAYRFGAAVDLDNYGQIIADDVADDGAPGSETILLTNPKVGNWYLCPVNYTTSQQPFTISINAGGTPAIRVEPISLTFVKSLVPPSSVLVTSSNAAPAAKDVTSNSSAGLIAVSDEQGRRVVPKGGIQVGSKSPTTSTTVTAPAAVRPKPVRKPAAHGKGEGIQLHGEFDMSSVARIDKNGKLKVYDEPASSSAKPVK